MKTLIITLIATLLLTFSCKKENQITTEKIEIEKEKVYPLPPTATFAFLEEAYQNQDTTSLRIFFDDWAQYSQNFEYNREDSLRKNIEEIFIAAYHPFDVEEYGWMGRPYHYIYKYVVIPTEIAYKVGDSISSDDILDEKLDTLKFFYPKVTVGNAKIIYNVDVYKEILEQFLPEVKEKRSNRERLYFLDCYINTPMSLRKRKYTTDPSISRILISPDFNDAYVTMRLISTGLGISLNKENGSWKMTGVEHLWIE